jgi:transposase-like protein
MSERDQIVSAGHKEGALDAKTLGRVLSRDGQLLLPMRELIQSARCAVDELIDVMGRATIEAVLTLSAVEVAGPKQQGKKTDRPIAWHGSQRGKVALKERQLSVSKPRLRRRNTTDGEQAEVEIPAYAAMKKNSRLSDRMMEILISGVSTRRYERVLPTMAETVGVSKSSVSRESIEAGERLRKQLAEESFADLDLLAIYVDGIQLGPFHVICAVGVDASGHKHVLGIRAGATENAEVAKRLLEDLVTRGVKADRKRLFVIDGSLALRKAIDQVFGSQNPVQRCRNHKLRNVLGHLPEDQREQAKLTLKAAFKLSAEEGQAKLEQFATWLERAWPSAAASIREGLSELFTINRLGLTAKLRRCLGTTNLIDNSHSCVRERTHRVKHWQSGSMALRWTAAAFDAASQNFRRIMGRESLWMLKAALDDQAADPQLVEKVKAG